MARGTGSPPSACRRLQLGAVGRCLRISRQAARQRYGALDGTPQPLVKRPVSEAERCMWLVNSAKDDVRRRREYAALPDDEATPW